MSSAEPPLPILSEDRFVELLSAGTALEPTPAVVSNDEWDHVADQVVAIFDRLFDPAASREFGALFLRVVSEPVQDAWAVSGRDAERIAEQMLVDGDRGP